MGSMKIAVTGASGFVGTYVLSELSRRDVKTVAASRSPAPQDTPALSTRWVALDINNPPADIAGCLGHPDVLIHLAWEGLPNYKSHHHFESVLPRQYEFLRRCVEQGISNISITGTCLEYGLQSGELGEDLPSEPTTPYGFAKDALRRQMEFLQSGQELNLTWLRLFYVYGKGQAQTSLLSQLEAALQRGDQNFNMSSGEQLRDFIRIEDAARLIVDLALKRQRLGIANVCSGSPVSVRSFVENYLHETGRNGKIRLNLGHYSYPDYESLAFWGSTKKLHNIL